MEVQWDVLSLREISSRQPCNGLELMRTLKAHPLVSSLSRPL